MQRDLPVIVLSPANGGRTCYGNSYEFQLCGQEECPPLTDFRSVHPHLSELSVSVVCPGADCVCVCVCYYRLIFFSHVSFREEQCKAWNPFYEHNGRKHHWLPYQHPDSNRTHL